MPTLDQLNELLDRRSASVSVLAPRAAAPDLSAVVDALREIAGRLEVAGSSDSAEASHLAHGAEMVKASQAIARAIAPLAEALKALEIPAPIVNVAAPAVTVEREPFPEVAEVERDAQGYIARVHFGKRAPAPKSSAIEPEFMT